MPISISELIQNTTPLLEILCAFFFVISFSSFKSRILDLLDYHNWKKALILSKIDEYNFLYESMSEFDGSFVPKSVIDDVDTEKDSLKQSYQTYLDGISKLDIRSTICFSRLAVTSGFYCIFILIFAALPGNGSDIDLYNSLLFFSIFYGVCINAIAFMDLFNRWVNIKLVRNFLHELSYSKVLFTLIILYIISIINYFIGLMYIPASISNQLLIMIVCFAPTTLILQYYVNYLLQYRYFRRKIRPLNVDMSEALSKSDDVYKKAKYTQNANRGGFKTS